MRSPMRRITAPSSCGPGNRSRRASRTASSTTRHTTGSPSSRECLRPAACPSSPASARFSRRMTSPAPQPASTSTQPAHRGSPASSTCARTASSATTSASQCCSPASAGPTNPRKRNREMRSFLGRDILSLKDFERNEFERVFEVCDELAPIAKNRRNTDLLANKTLLTAFYQPSTRTRMSTEAAMHRLGGHVLGFSDSKMTRAGDFYQETMKDTIHMLEFYADVIAMRHF